MTLFQMSFYGAVMILAIIIIRAFTLHKLPKKVFLILWGIALLRLLVPFEIASGFSIYSLLPEKLTAPLTATQDAKTNLLDSADVRTSEVITSDNPVTYPYAGIVVIPESTSEIPIENTDTITAPATPVHPNTVEETAPVHSEAGRSIVLTPSTLTVVQVTGTLLLALFFLIAYLKCYAEFRTSLPVKEAYVQSWLALHPLRRKITIRQSDKITTPLTYGLFHPVILLPKNTDWENKNQLDYILYHEYTHIRRFDLVTKLFLTAALCLHWFNPFVWLMYLFFNRDIELACDESVVKHSEGQEKSAYALTLISMEEKKLYLAPLCNNFSKNAVEERITAIMKLKKTTLSAILAGIVLIIIVAATLMTSARETGGSGEVLPTPFPTVTATPTPGEFLEGNETTSPLITPKAGAAESLISENDFPRNGYSTPHKLNVRWGAGYNYAILTTIPTKTAVNILAVEQDAAGEYWYQVSLTLEGTEINGYINSQYITVNEVGSSAPIAPEDLLAADSFPKQGTATPTRLNVRQDAGYDYAILTQIENNTRISILGIKQAADGEYWYQVTFTRNGDTISGYINSQYILVTDSIYTEGEVRIPSPNTGSNNFFTFTDEDFPRGGAISVESLSVRKGPGYHYTIISNINPSTSIEILAQETAEDGSLWYKISYYQSNSSHTGYVDAQYVWVSALTPKELLERTASSCFAAYHTMLNTLFQTNLKTKSLITSEDFVTINGNDGYVMVTEESFPKLSLVTHYMETICTKEYAEELRNKYWHMNTDQPTLAELDGHLYTQIYDGPYYPPYRLTEISLVNETTITIQYQYLNEEEIEGSGTVTLTFVENNWYVAIDELTWADSLSEEEAP